MLAPLNNHFEMATIKLVGHLKGIQMSKNAALAHSWPWMVSGLVRKIVYKAV